METDIHALMTDEKSAKVNSPSTTDIAKALRVCYVKLMACSECPFESEDCGHIDEVAADRLESLESELLQKTQELERNKEIIVRLDNTCRDLNIRADQLEMERDAYMAECDSGRNKGYNEGYSDGYQDGTKGI